MTIPKNIRIEVKGLKELQKKNIAAVKALEGTPMVKIMQKATLWVTADAKRPPNMPVDTGRLRASITPRIIRIWIVNLVRGIVGSNVEYAPYQELGTRFMEGRFFLKRSLDKNRERISLLIQKFAIDVAKGKA